MGIEPTGHDWFHVERVYKNALYIAKNENGCDIFIVKLASLLHDIADWKFHDDPEAGEKTARIWLEKNNVSKEVIDRVCGIVATMSYRGGTNPPMKTIEGKIVQDADRLDALGAIGIARAFAFGGYKERQIYNPKLKPKKYKTAIQYKNSNGTTINHFYEKLLLLSNKMNTKTGKRIAARRHKILENYLEEFYKEWDSDLS